MLLTTGNGVDSIVQFITVLIIFVVVLLVTLFVTKWIAGFQKQQQVGNNVKVVETTRISPSQYVQILKIGSKYVAIAVSKENTTKLLELTEEELVISEENMANAADFGAVFSKIKESISNKKKDE